MTAPRYKEGQGIALAELHAQVRRLRRWVLLTAALATISATAAAFGFHRASEARQNVQQLTLITRSEARDTTFALCTFRKDLEVRVAASRKFLASHPDGFAGVPVRTIREGISNQERTIGALSGIDC
jgi:hypothetical protein